MEADDEVLVGGEGGAPRTKLALRMPRETGTDGLPLFVAGLVPPPRARPRMACPPKLMRRVKGVVGAVRALEVASSSSMAFSSMESELLVEMLPLRRPKDAAAVGEVPDRPSVEMERRRRWSFMAADVMGPAKTGFTADVELLRGKRFANVADVTELRRLREVPAALSWLSDDMAAAWEGIQGTKDVRESQRASLQQQSRAGRIG